MFKNRKYAISNIVATLLLISLVIAGTSIYYVVAISYLKPQPDLSSTLTITVGASGFVTINANVVNTGNIAFTSLTITITGSSPPPKLQITYSSPLSPNGGTATITVRGLSGGNYTSITSNPNIAVSGSLNAVVGSTYTVIVRGTLVNGGSYSETFPITALPG